MSDEQKAGLALLRAPLETWRPVFGYERFYSVSDFGRIRSERRTRMGKSRKLVTVNERIMRPTVDADGYQRVRLCNGMTKSMFNVHYLVLATFHGPRPIGMQACHNNGIPGDNRANNLRWGTPRSNQRDRLIHGTSSNGEQNGSAKLTETAVRDIRADCRRNYDIAAEYGVSRRTIGRIKSGASWACVEGVK
jgi:hypothetical protein